MSCHSDSYSVSPNSNDGKTHIRVALAGNPNVGKSVVFNNLSGLSQVVGNWPGKTVSKAEGQVMWGDFVFNLIDLPGIYSLSTYSLEEIVAREYLIKEKPDFILNIVDANYLERNLFFTMQLLMLELPVVISLNQYDLLQERGYEIDIPILSAKLGIVATPSVAVHNRGVHELLEECLKQYKESKRLLPQEFILGKEIESRLQLVIAKFKELYPEWQGLYRFIGLKILENDIELLNALNIPNDVRRTKLIEYSTTYRKELEELHGEQISTILNAELYTIAHQITEQVLKIRPRSKKQKFLTTIDHLTIHSVWGYVLLFAILLGSYTGIFYFGDWLSGLADLWLEAWNPGAIALFGGEETWLYKILYNGIFTGFIGGVGGVLPYVIPFYLFLELLQDIGYLPRAAYLMDKFMHKIGVHGKTIIPMLLGFGCKVPAITACMIMETEKEKRRSILISSMIPCSAVTTIVLGLVAKFLGIEYALLLYVVNFIVIIIIGKIFTMKDQGQGSELIIEFHDFRKPNFGVLLKQTWHRSKDFITMAIPIIIVLSISIQIILEFDLFESLNNVFSPIVVDLLGLPIGIGAFLIYGIFRKELNLVLLEVYVISLGLSLREYLSPIQMLVFTIITMLYIPCLSTIVVIKRHEGAKFATQVSLFQLIVGIGVGALLRWTYEAVRILSPVLNEFGAIFWTFVLSIGLLIVVITYLVKIQKKTAIAANKGICIEDEKH